MVGSTGLTQQSGMMPALELGTREWIAVAILPLLAGGIAVLVARRVVLRAGADDVGWAMRLILIDRDGVLNVDRPDSVRNPGELVPIPGSAAAVARLNAAGVRVAVVTNQAVVGRGIIGPDMLEQIHHRLADDLRRAGARIDAWFVCTDAPMPRQRGASPGPACCARPWTSSASPPPRPS